MFAEVEGLEGFDWACMWGRISWLFAWAVIGVGVWGGCKWAEWVGFSRSI